MFTNFPPQAGGKQSLTKSGPFRGIPPLLHSQLHPSSTVHPRVSPNVSPRASTRAAGNRHQSFDDGAGKSLVSAGRSPRDNGRMCARGRRTSVMRPRGLHCAAWPGESGGVRSGGAAGPGGQVEGATRVSALAWWIIPIAITALAIAFVSVRGRVSEPRVDPMAERRRMREAMERPIPGDSRDSSTR